MMLHAGENELLHAYCVSGNAHTLIALKSELSALQHISLEQHPDVFEVSTDTLLVSEAREVVSFASHAPMIRGGAKYIFISCMSATTEAQNALLKTLEEPPLHTHIFFITPRVDALLPTIRSRCVLLDGQTDNQHDTLPHTTDKLLAYIADINQAKDTARMNELLDVLERRAEQMGNKEAMQTVMEVKEYFYDKGAMRKMLLESVVLML